MLESLESKISTLPDILANIRNLSDIKTSIGRTRAWMRLALMQKVLAEQMLVILEERDLLLDWYERSAILVSDEGAVFAGLLVGLNVIDCNFDLKGHDLDNQASVIDISLYLRDGNYLEKTHEETSSTDQENGQKFEVILDQKAYLEQINKNLNETVTNLKQRAKEREELDMSTGEEVEQLRNRLVGVIAEREQYKRDYETLLEDHNKRLNDVNNDLTVERETYEQSRSGLNDMYLQAQKEVDTEKRDNKELNMLLEEHKQINKEKELAMQLLEQDIHDKQETLISLRRQLEDIKRINLELHNKWQSSEKSLKKHEEEWSNMEQKCTRMIANTKDMEKNLKSAEEAKQHAEETSHQIGMKLAQVQTERHTLETDLKIEREWRSGMQAELNAEKEKREEMEKQLSTAQITIAEHEELKRQLEKSQQKLRDQETALMEVGKQLNKSHTQVDELKELHAITKEQQWQSDKEADECQQCCNAFTLARRKHHCRKCGGIFCNNCSDNTMPLPSSAKPVRVCDDCHKDLLERYTSGQ
eukprot:TCONS_00035099-protein